MAVILNQSNEVYIKKQATTIHELKKRIDELEKPIEDLELELEKYIKEQKIIEKVILAQASTIDDLQKRIAELEKPSLLNKKWKTALRIYRSSWNWF
jgi:hypothetical protein